MSSPVETKEQLFLPVGNEASLVQQDQVIVQAIG